jgi:hypothetical protein
MSGRCASLDVGRNKRRMNSNLKKIENMLPPEEHFLVELPSMIIVMNIVAINGQPITMKKFCVDVDKITVFAFEHIDCSEQFKDLELEAAFEKFLMCKLCIGCRTALSLDYMTKLGTPNMRDMNSSERKLKGTLSTIPFVANGEIIEKTMRSVDCCGLVEKM